VHALIIEDQLLIANMIWGELRRLGYRSIDIVESEEEAIALARQQCPDLITADDRLASGSGIDAVLTICADKVIPVVFIVGNPWNVKLAIPDAVILEKPFSLDALTAAVKEAKVSARALALH
jgi:two-component system, response regulator PdtaR